MKVLNLSRKALVDLKLVVECVQLSEQCDRLLQSQLSITDVTKPEIEFQYGGRLCFSKPEVFTSQP